MTACRYTLHAVCRRRSCPASWLLRGRCLLPLLLRLLPLLPRLLLLMLWALQR
jgi:hypothetical protein